MSSIMQYNGAAVIAMAGKDCVAIASDKRYGIQNQTVGCDMQKTFQINDKTFIGLTGLATDVQTLEQKFRFRTNMYRLREERDISPSSFSNMVSSLLYEKRCATPSLLSSLLSLDPSPLTLPTVPPSPFPLLARRLTSPSKFTPSSLA